MKVVHKANLSSNAILYLAKRESEYLVVVKESEDIRFVRNFQANRLAAWTEYQKMSVKI